MPYFLVTHTSLVEADDDASAAAKVYGAICDSEKLSFDVKADEHTTTRIIIPTRVRIEPKAQPHSDLTSLESKRLGTAKAAESEASDDAIATSIRPVELLRSTCLLLCAGVGIVAAFYGISRLFA